MDDSLQQRKKQRHLSRCRGEKTWAHAPAPPQTRLLLHYRRLVQLRARHLRCCLLAGAGRRMLAADKLLLQSNVKQRSIALREKELKLFNSNFSAVGTQSAIMAGFTLTSFVEIDLPPNKAIAKVHTCNRTL